MPPAVRVIDTTSDCPEIPIVRGGGNCRVVLWPGNGASHRSLHLLTMEAGASTVNLQHSTDCVYYVIGGSGSVSDLGSDEAFDVAEGAMVHVDSGDCYRIVAGEAGIRLIGGPCPPDEALYADLRFAGGAL